MQDKLIKPIEPMNKPLKPEEPQRKLTDHHELMIYADEDDEMTPFSKTIDNLPDGISIDDVYICQCSRYFILTPKAGSCTFFSRSRAWRYFLYVKIGNEVLIYTIKFSAQLILIGF